MSVYPLPQYQKLTEFDSEKLNEIEQLCIKENHLSPNEKLLDRIAIDTEILTSFGLTQESIYINHRNLFLKFNKTNEYNAYTTIKNDHIQQFTDILPINFGRGWCCRGNTSNEINLNGQHLKVTRFIWGGAEQCPIEKFISSKYHGYERGDRDWFVTNMETGQSLWIPDLLPAQVGMFGFWQSPSSPYRVDPIAYIKLFGLDKEQNITLLNTKTIIRWDSYGNGPFNEQYINNNIINKKDEYDEVDVIDNDDYYAAKTIKDNRELLYILYKNTDFLKSHDNEDIDIFNLPFKIQESYQPHRVYQHTQCKQVLLNEGDESNEINLISKKESEEKCVVQ